MKAKLLPFHAMLIINTLYLILEVFIFRDVEVAVDAVELARVEYEVGVAEELARAPHLLSDGGARVAVQPAQMVQPL